MTFEDDFIELNSNEKYDLIKSLLKDFKERHNNFPDDIYVDKDEICVSLKDYSESWEFSDKDSIYLSKQCDMMRYSYFSTFYEIIISILSDFLNNPKDISNFQFTKINNKQIYKPTLNIFKS